MKLYRCRGQHILKNRKIAERIVDYAEVRSSDHVLEVGCGTGILTQFLLEKAGKVTGVEIDERFVSLLKKKFKSYVSSDKFKLICGDALKVKFPEFDKFVSNIPYSISSPLTFKVLTYRKKSVIMYQKEFAERIVATSGRNYGRLSVMVRAFSTPRIVEFVSKKNFVPEPKVDSAIVLFEPKPEISVKNIDTLKKIVTACFCARRKKLLKVLRKMNVDESLLKKYGEKRAEEIKPEEYAEIANSVLHVE